MSFLVPLARRSAFRPQRPAALLQRTFGLSLVRSRWDQLVLHEEVEDALSTGKPVVALETAILTHGLPYPLNLEVTLKLSKLVREGGAVPATIALLAGVPTVGLTHAELQRLADPEIEAVKVSRRDLAPAMAFKKDGGTTVAGTMWLAQQAGIDVFVTGGIGGVHRDGENSLDVSADLTELGRTPVAVVCAGCKSILDIGRTIEYLETQGVTVATLGKTNDFPAFYTPKSGFKSPWSMETPEEAAQMIHRAITFPTPLASLIAVPVPDEWAAAGLEVQAFVEQAVRESVAAGVRGKESTPWLLARVAELTKGSSVKSNIALIENNTRLGTQIAVHLAALKAGKTSQAKPYPGGHVIPPPYAAAVAPLPDPKMLVVGSAAIDLTTRPSSVAVVGSKTTVPGTVSLTPGGVGLNMALCAHRLSSDKAAVLLLAPRADDSFGRVLEGEVRSLGMRTDGLLVVGDEAHAGGRTAVCSLVLDLEGNLDGGVADMEIVERVDAQLIVDRITSLRPSLVALDGNLSASTLSILLTHCASLNILTVFEPTSLPKSKRVLDYLGSQDGAAVDVITPNLLELRGIHAAADERGLFESATWWKTVDGLGLGEDWRSAVERWARRSGAGEWVINEGAIHMLTSLSPFFRTQLVKLGPLGCLSLRLLPELLPPSSTPTTLNHGRLSLSFHPGTALPEGAELNTTGAGDSLVGAVLAGLIQTGNGRPASAVGAEEWARVVDRGQRAARASLAVSSAVGKVGGPGWEL